MGNGKALIVFKDICPDYRTLPIRKSTRELANRMHCKKIYAVRFLVGPSTIDLISNETHRFPSPMRYHMEFNILRTLERMNVTSSVTIAQMILANNVRSLISVLVFIWGGYGLLSYIFYIFQFVIRWFFLIFSFLSVFLYL